MPEIRAQRGLAGCLPAMRVGRGHDGARARCALVGGLSGVERKAFQGLQQR